ncbi:UDP-glycosyltransferase UGT5-like isoform X1 [Pieris napi]|uniref:UDP-glycosyltransferase UGT5-like isoform X1 n=1 Tax=Pieris napi TaxID=78633 RepID=UPI001FB96D93|nr:UDP-glycosyltransferase UGT5-like isoform X1 [Pieris napi]
MYTIKLLFTFLITAQNSNGARILGVFPTSSLSHQVVFRPLTQELARIGHEVTVITTDPAFNDHNRPANLTEIDVHDVSYNLWIQKMKEKRMEFGDKAGVFKTAEGMSSFFAKVIEEQLKTDGVQKLINDKSKKYDLIIIEACARPAILFSHLYKAPVIAISSFGMAFGGEDLVGAPSHPILYPNMLHQRLHNLTFWEKLNEFYKHYWIVNMWKSSEYKDFNIFKKYFGGDDVPPYKELNKNVDMMFLNIHPIWSHNQPLPPNVISIWGIYKKPQKSLPQDLQEYLDSSKNGVIYISFGSNIRSSMLPPEKIKILINVFSKLPYNILWKWETDVLPGKSKNIKIAKWLPQSDLLRHPNIKLFITQGGLQSMDEAMNAGIPLIGIPMFGDQWYNVESFEYHKIGLGVELNTLTEEKLTTAIETVINDKSYKENIIRLNRLMNDQSQTALERAIWWTEYVLRHGGAKHLRAAGANISYFEYYEIEFLLKLVSLVFSIAAIILYSIYTVYRIILPSNIRSNKSKTS